MKSKNKNEHQSGFLYNLTLVAAVAQPMMTVPQAVQIYTTHDVAGVSLVTWTGFLIFGAIFLAYGIKYRLKPIIVAQSLWFVTQASVVIGILIWS